MSDAIWLTSALLFTLFGLFLWRFDDLAALDLPARISLAFAAGIAVGGTLMYAESLAGLRWSRLTVAVPMIAFAALARRGSPAPRQPLVSWAPPAAVVLLAFYGAATARMTCGDLLFFWGPKGQRFFQSGAIDVEFLKFPHYYLMHPDYPPLQPLAYAWSSVAAGRFSYWGAVLLAPLYLAAAVLVFRGFAAPALGARRANAWSTLLAAILALGFTAGRAAGGADPLLLLFEIVALAALTFGEGRGSTVLAAIALAGAGFTKVEGAAFVAVAAVALLLARRDWRRALAVTAPAAVLLGSWILFARHHGLLDAYNRADAALQWQNLGTVLRATGLKASYGAWYLPWIGALTPLAFGRRWRRASLPLLVACAAVAYTIYFYLHEPQPLWWILASAERVLLTAVASFVVASAAASE